MLNAPFSPLQAPLEEELGCTLPQLLPLLLLRPKIEQLEEPRRSSLIVFCAKRVSLLWMQHGGDKTIDCALLRGN